MLYDPTPTELITSAMSGLLLLGNKNPFFVSNEVLELSLWYAPTPGKLFLLEWLTAKVDLERGIEYITDFYGREV